MGKNRVGDEIQNKQIIFRDYVIGYTQEADLYISTIKLQVPQGSNAVLVKNMYLSCDPTMQFLMRKDESPLSGSYKYIPGSPIYGFGVAKILDSGHPSFIA
ncbi:NADP-dependent alkenal double bond reductase p2, partial [Trifolium pratense]